MDILEHFSERFAKCSGDVEKQHELASLILERVYVDGDIVVAITLKSDFHVVLGHKKNEPTYLTVDPYLSEWT